MRMAAAGPTRRELPPTGFAYPIGVSASERGDLDFGLRGPQPYNYNN